MVRWWLVSRGRLRNISYCVTCGKFTDISQEKLLTGLNVRWNVGLYEKLHYVEHIKQQLTKRITKKAAPCGCRRL